eukprot:scaffold46362_cov68-Phaeocystis_antarctica.AAC.8
MYDDRQALFCAEDVRMGTDPKCVALIFNTKREFTLPGDTHSAGRKAAFLGLVTSRQRRLPATAPSHLAPLKPAVAKRPLPRVGRLDRVRQARRQQPARANEREGQRDALLRGRVAAATVAQPWRVDSHRAARHRHAHCRRVRRAPPLRLVAEVRAGLDLERTSRLLDVGQRHLH